MRLIACERQLRNQAINPIALPKPQSLGEESSNRRAYHTCLAYCWLAALAVNSLCIRKLRRAVSKPPMALKDAWPPEMAAEPTTLAPSRNWTVPVAVAGVTRAVNVTAVPTIDGFKEDERTTEVFALTICESTLELAAA